ncbi:hypothetical protein PG996_000283 [Apiospora saccharicola]|uniref:Uncharacterized protein n=1 Tax=Apiospora saccharicola TaxID=335842 RepID=A0ABR1WER0_9PEZI
MAAPGNTQEHWRNIAAQAEKDLNSYQAKTGAGKTSVNDEAGVDTRVENKFPGAEVRYDDDLSTSGSYNKRIPPQEGGEVDARGRQTRGEHFEGEGGPEQKYAQQQRDLGGHDNANEVGSTNGPRASEADVFSQSGHGGNGEALSEGKAAAEANTQSDSHLRHKGQFKGSDYYTPESVPDSISAEGNVAPESVVQSSRKAENP